MKSILSSFSIFLSLASALTIKDETSAKRQLVTAGTLYQDITNIHQAVLANTGATQVFTGGNLVTTLADGVPIIATVGAIHLANRKGFADANLSGPINEADTQRIVDHTVDTVGKSIPTDIDVLVSKKQAFVSTGQGPLVLSGLKLLLNDHDTFSAALLQKAYKGNAALNAEATDVVAKIHNAIQSGINAYST